MPRLKKKNNEPIRRVEFIGPDAGERIIVELEGCTEYIFKELSKRIQKYLTDTVDTDLQTYGYIVKPMRQTISFQDPSDEDDEDNFA